MTEEKSNVSHFSQESTRGVSDWLKALEIRVEELEKVQQRQFSDNRDSAQRILDLVAKVNKQLGEHMWTPDAHNTAILGRKATKRDQSSSEKDKTKH